jgi:hypothetical protein
MIRLCSLTLRCSSGRAGKSLDQYRAARRVSLRARATFSRSKVGAYLLCSSETVAELGY